MMGAVNIKFFKMTSTSFSWEISKARQKTTIHACNVIVIPAALAPDNGGGKYW